MLFNDSFLTVNGTNLLARATAEHKLVWTRCATSSLDSSGMSTYQMNHIDDATFGAHTSDGGITNSITSESDGTATIYCELNNSLHYGYAKTFAVWAKIDGDVEDKIAIVARCGSGVEPVYINNKTSGNVKAFVNFSIVITAEKVDAIQVQEGDYYATTNALQNEIQSRIDLASRVVTIHSSDGEGIGEDQTILGNKTFTNNVEVNGDGYFNSDAYFNSSIKLNIIEKASDYTDGVTLSTNILPLPTNTYSIGSNFRRLNNIYTNNAYFNQCSCDNLTSSVTAITVSKTLIPSSSSVTIGTSDNEFNRLYCYRVDSTATYTEELNVSSIGSNALVYATYIRVLSDLEPVGRINLGSVAPFQSVSAESFNASSLKTATITSKSGSLGSVGFDCNIMPSGQRVIGSKENPFAQVNATVLNGVIPTMSLATEASGENIIPIGTIVMLVLMKASGSFTTLSGVSAGDSFSAPSGTINGDSYDYVYIASLGVDSGSGSQAGGIIKPDSNRNRLTHGRFKALSSGGNVNGTQLFIPVLAIKVED